MKLHVSMISVFFFCITLSILYDNIEVRISVSVFLFFFVVNILPSIYFKLICAFITNVNILLIRKQFYNISCGDGVMLDNVA